MTIKRIKQVDGDTLDILKSSLVWHDSGTMCRIVEQLAPTVYKGVIKVLGNYGGKWTKNVTAQWEPLPELPGNLGKGAIVFSKDPREDIGLVIDNGAMTVIKDGFFPTPDKVINLMVNKVIDGWGGSSKVRVLEPQAGQGDICFYLMRYGYTDDPGQIDVCELNEERRGVLAGMGLNVIGDDFLVLEADPVYDYVIMNPPFEQGQEVQHIQHAYNFLKPGGSLVSVASPGVTFREDRLYHNFRGWLIEVDGEVEPLPDGSFEESGTGVATVLISITKE